MESKEKREKMEDIVSQIRAAAYIQNADQPKSVLRFADRIEAAWKRQEQCYLDQIRDAVNMIGHERFVKEHPPVGNAATMREALASVRNWCLRKLCNISFQVTVEGLLSIVEAALSAPARNCDRYKDAPSAYADFIVPWKLDGHLDDIPTLQDFANWLFAPAAERKGECDGR